MGPSDLADVALDSVFVIEQAALDDPLDGLALAAAVEEVSGFAESAG